ncbi:hypothetical protein [Skermania piniformis]|uniref:DUF222 domain-containing protein n=1 Tax=Skermania pinensis TaxID=39122 RepID=A0ABX8SAJ5_9ACTN|nr:hypothetical protein [Skermania piniformis]QXQ14879.1 hypothetical protein KV203_05710 [Skermania piniformis]
MHPPRSDQLVPDGDLHDWAAVATDMAIASTRAATRIGLHAAVHADKAVQLSCPERSAHLEDAKVAAGLARDLHALADLDAARSDLDPIVVDHGVIRR